MFFFFFKLVSQRTFPDDEQQTKKRTNKQKKKNPIISASIAQSQRFWDGMRVIVQTLDEHRGGVNKVHEGEGGGESSKKFKKTKDGCAADGA